MASEKSLPDFSIKVHFSDFFLVLNPLEFSVGFIKKYM